MSLSPVERFQGCLLGQAFGDAVGFMVEGQSPESCRSFVSEIMNDQVALTMHQRGPYVFGQYSDDTQCARELLESLLTKNRFDQNDYGHRIAELFVEDRIVGRGRATEAAAFRIAQGVPVNQAGTPAPAAGNGSAMRAAPIGLYARDRVQLIDWARRQGEVTHTDPRASAGAIAIARAVQLVQTDSRLEPYVFLDDIASCAAQSSELFAAELRKLKDWLAMSPEHAVEPIANAGKDEDFVERWWGISPYVVGSVLWSIYAFLKTPKDPWMSLETAIAVGGDVDTTAAMTGAISGCYNGIQALPMELLKLLNDRGEWDCEDLMELAEEAAMMKEATQG